MKKILITITITLLILLIAFTHWRRKAPTYQGQDLHPILSATGEAEILLLGDMGTGDANQTAIANAMNTYCETNPLTAIIFLGDNFYPSGVDSTEDPQWQSKFYTPYNLPCLKNVPFYALLGNHDYKGKPEAQIEQANTKKNKNETLPKWNMPHRFYDLRIGNLLTLTMLDTNILDYCGIESRCTLDLMNASLKNQTTPFQIVLGHHPVLSSSGKYSDRDIQGRILERLLCDKTHYYVAGHSHHLEHLIAPGCQTPLDLFVVGGGGADLYTIKTWAKSTRFAESKFGFLSLKANADSLHFSFFDKDLRKLYDTIKTKNEESGPPTQSGS